MSPPEEVLLRECPYWALTVMTAVAVLVCPLLSVTRKVMLFEGVPKLYVKDGWVLIALPLDCQTQPVIGAEPALLVAVLKAIATEPLRATV